MLAMLLGVAMLLTLVAPTALADTENDTYRILYSGEVSTLNYLITATANEYELAGNFIDTLIEYDKYGVVQPSLAESWTTSEDGLTWTFKIRQGVPWVNGKGEAVAEVTANDFVSSAKYILNAQNAAATASIVYGVVEGAEAYFMGTSTPEEGAEPAPVTEWETVGVKALDDYTLEYKLVQPVPYFLSMLPYVDFMPVYGPFLDEQGANFGVAGVGGNESLLYCGAYYLAEFNPQENRLLTKNTLNWDADNVFIENISYIRNEDLSNAPEMFLRGEVDEAEIDSAIASEWFADPEKADKIRPVRPDIQYSYFYGFNFDPQFDAAYEPENWKIVVNNLNFRKAVFYALDRVKAAAVYEPEYPESLVFNTITLPQFAAVGETDFVNMGDLAPITALGLNTLDEAKAIEYRDLAKAELEAAGATFPIKALMPYNPNTAGWDQECQVVEQQLEALLGSDFIDIIPEAGPTQNFLSETRRAGKYAFQKLNWGCDYLDPETFTDPFKAGNNYNFMDKGMTGDFVATYYAMVEAAKAITADQTARYEAFAAAEAYLIDNAVVIPTGVGPEGYIACRLDPFEAQYSSAGVTNGRFKGQHLMDHAMSTDEYFDAYDAWLEAIEAMAE
jgi:oligopeptide transport system substrate-binding protein